MQSWPELAQWHTSGMNSPPSDYTGPVYHEKKFYQTHFQGINKTPTHPKDDPDWECVGVGRYKLDLSHQMVYLLDKRVLACGVCGWIGSITIEDLSNCDEARNEYKNHKRRKPTGARYARR